MDSLRRFFDRFVHRVQSREDTTSSGVQPVREADAALAQKQLANRLFEEGRAARERGDPEAVPLLRRCLEIQERLLAEDDPFLAPTRNELGLALKEAGSLGEASDLFLRAHTYFARCQGEKHADYANTLHNYAATLLQRGEYEEGLAHMRRALDVRERLGNASPLDLSNTYWILGSAMLGQESIALLERALHERARAGETTGPALAAIWRELANTLADERQHLRAMMARRQAARACLEQPPPVADAPQPPVETLKQARVELRYGVMSEANVIDLAVELVRDGGALAGDEALMELACLDTRLDGDRARTQFSLDRALEVHAPGWRLETDGHELAQLVLDVAAQEFLERPSDADPPAEDALRPLADILWDMEADFGSQPWLSHFRVDVAGLRDACRAYLADRKRAEDPDAARERQRERTERDAALERAAADFERGRSALREARPGGEAALRSAVKAFERWLPDARRTATAQNELALVLKAKGALQEAAGLFRKAHDYFGARHGDRDPDTAITMHNLGATLSQMGDHQGGGELLERSLELQLHYRYTPTVDIANNYETLGENLYARGNLKEARAMLEDALALREQGHCAGPLDVAATCAHLSEVAKEQGDYATAESLARRVVTLRSEALGHFHRDTADALNQLGVVLFSQGRLDEAEQQFRQALGRFQEEAGLHDPFAINARINLAKVLLKPGSQSLFEALEVVQQALRACDSALEPGHEYTARALSTLGEAYRLLGRYAEAVPVLTRARELHERRFGPNHLKTAYCANSLGLVFEKCGALEEAERMLQQAERVFAAELGADHADARTALCNRAHVLFLRGQAAEAERIWTELLQRGANGEAAYRLGQLLEAQGRMAAATDRYAQALQTFEETHGRGSWHVALASEALGRMHLAREEIDRAEQCIERAWSVYARLYGPLHEDTNRALSALVDAVQRRDVELAIGILNRALEDIKGDSAEEELATAQLALQLGVLLRRAHRLPEAASVLSAVFSARRKVFRFDSELAVSAGLALAQVRADMRDDAAMLRTLQQALVRCDAEPNADEGAVARISNVYALELFWRGRRQEAAMPAHRAWTYFRRAERGAEDAAVAFALHWRTALSRKHAARSWRPRPATGPWLLRIEFHPAKTDELAPLVEWVLRMQLANVRSDAEIKHGQNELVVRADSGTSGEKLAVQTDLICALAEYPRLRWKRWTMSCVAAGEEAVHAEGTDGPELLATWE